MIIIGGKTISEKEIDEYLKAEKIDLSKGRAVTFKVAAKYTDSKAKDGKTGNRVTVTNRKMQIRPTAKIIENGYRKEIHYTDDPSTVPMRDGGRVILSNSPRRIDLVGGKLSTSDKEVIYFLLRSELNGQAYNIHNPRVEAEARMAKRSLIRTATRKVEDETDRTIINTIANSYKIDISEERTLDEVKDDILLIIEGDKTGKEGNQIVSLLNSGKIEIRTLIDVLISRNRLTFLDGAWYSINEEGETAEEAIVAVPSGFDKSEYLRDFLTKPEKQIILETFKEIANNPTKEEEDLVREQLIKQAIELNIPGNVKGMKLETLQRKVREELNKGERG